MNKPTISIIVPVYNVKDYLEECFDSISNQTFKDFEIIIIDDGSNDGSEKICDELAIKDKRAKVFHYKNGGNSKARNLGISKITGEYCVFIDSDDYVEKNYLEKLYETIKTNNCDVAVCGFYDGKIPPLQTISGQDASRQLLIEQENYDIVVWNKIFKKEIIKNVVFPEIEKHEDTLTTYKILASANKVSYIQDQLYHYRQRKNSIMASDKMEEKILAREKAAKEACEYFKNQPLENAAKISLLLAEYAFVDHAIRGEIAQKYLETKISWVQNHIKEYDKNPELTKKLKLYNSLIKIGNGTLYKLFRKII